MTTIMAASGDGYEKDKLDLALNNLTNQFGSGQKGLFGYNFQIVAIFLLVSVGLVCIVNAIVSRSYRAFKEFKNAQQVTPNMSASTQLRRPL